MDILCSGPIPPNPAELLQTKAFTDTLARLLSVYDRVIFDSPPVVPVTDAQILGRQLDGTILVAFSNRTHKDMFQKAISLLNAVQVNLLGFVLNGIDLSQETYGHYYYQYQSDKTPESQLEETFGEANDQDSQV
jgi:capsular exopolysaccharide synthesis family protein